MGSWAVTHSKKLLPWLVQDQGQQPLTPSPLPWHVGFLLRLNKLLSTWPGLPMAHFGSYWS